MKCLLLILLFVSPCLQAQDLSGKWTGEQVGPESTETVLRITREGIVRERVTTLERYRLEVNLVQTGNKLRGTTKYWDMDSPEWVEHRVTGTIEGNQVTIVEEQVIADAGRSDFYFGTIKGDLIIDSVNKRLIIKGMIFHQRLYDHMSRTATNENADAGGIRITKPFPADNLETPVATVTTGKKRDTLELPIQPRVSQLPVNEVARRKKQVVHSFEVTADSLQLEFYDDSDIDDDTITVYYNRQLLFSKQRLTGKAITISIAVLPGTDNELVMFANNVGSIPPNTALLVFYENGVRKEIRIDSDTQKSGTVIFRKK